MSRVVVTGLGLVTSIGTRRDEVLASLREGRHGCARWDPVPGCAVTVKVAAPVRGFNVVSPNPNAWTWPAAFDLDRTLVRSLPPHGVYAACAIQQALAESGLGPRELRDGDTGLCCASAGSPMLQRHHLNGMADTGWQRVHPFSILASVAGTLNFNFAAHYGIRGASCGFVSACTSGSHALGYAFDEIALGRQRRMLVVAAEELNAEILLPFTAMNALSLNPDPDTASRPFDQARDGFVGTGGAVAFVLENEDAARSRGVPPQAVMRGWAQAADGHHIAHPEPTGAGLRTAMEKALAASDVARSQIGYVNAHAASTPEGDRAEAFALRAVFAAHGAHPPVSSTKALTGHGLSLAGAMEAAFCVLALADGVIPGNPHLREPAPACAGLDLPRPSLAARPDFVLNNSSGFGGTNVCHVFARYA